MDGKKDLNDLQNYLSFVFDHGQIIDEDIIKGHVAINSAFLEFLIDEGYLGRMGFRTAVDCGYCPANAEGWEGSYENNDMVLVVLKKFDRYK